MELYLLNTLEGLKPCYDSDYDEKKKILEQQAQIDLGYEVGFLKDIKRAKLLQ